MTARTPSKPPSSMGHENPTPNVEDQVRRRAYELYEQRGIEHGHDVDDWLRAEEEIKQTRTRRVAA